MEVSPQKFKSRQVFSILLSGTLVFCVLFFLVPNLVRVRYAQSRNTCINNLRQIDGAKQQWALERQKPDGAIPTSTEITVYLKNNHFPVCPAGGSYLIGCIAEPPRCSIGDSAWPNEHVLYYTNNSWRNFTEAYRLLLGLRHLPSQER